MTALLTGSHAYGEPGDDSDIDLVVLLGDEAIKVLSEASEEDVRYPDAASMAMRFGPLNLLVCRDSPAGRAAFAVWRQGTEVLQAAKPVTREVAVETFRALRKEARLYPSPGNPRCRGCGEAPQDLSEYQSLAETDDPVAVLSCFLREEGTYNPETGGFWCTACYVRAGQPLGRAP